MPKIVLELDCSFIGYLYNARYLYLNVGMYEILNFSRNHRFFFVFLTFSPKMGKTWNISMKHPILPLYEVFEQNIASKIKSWIGPKMALTEPSPLNFLVHSIRNIWIFKVVLCQRSFPFILRDFSVQQTPKCQNDNFDKIMQKREIIFVYLSNTDRILCIFNQFAKRNEIFIIRLINTGGTSGQNFTRLRR